MNKGRKNAIANEKVFRWWDYIIFSILSAVGIAAILLFMKHWFSIENFRGHPMIFLILTTLLIVSLGNNQGRWFLLPFMRRPKPMPIRHKWRVGVATSFVPGAEPIEMLELTLKALIALDYPHDTWVLDEGDSEEVKDLCWRLGANHFSRKNLPQYQAESGTFQSGWKHGNYNAWLHEIAFDRYDTITVFDPDHIPNEGFLSSVLGYFEHPKIAYVQVAQSYYNQAASFIARGASEEVYSYYSLVQMASHGLGAPVIIGGHTSHRVAALKQVGGFPPHNADDILITLLYRSSDWQGVYVPRILARGMTPVDWDGYLRQQQRWARSVLDIKFRIYPKLVKSLPVKTFIVSFLHGLSYVHKSLTFLTLILIVGYALVTGVLPRPFSLITFRNLFVLFLVLEVKELYRQRFYLHWPSERGLHLRAKLLQYAKWPYILLALFSVILNRPVPFALTRKIGGKPGRSLLIWPQLLVIIFISTAWAIGWACGNTIIPILYVSSALLVFLSLGLILTGFKRFPEPYDAELAAFQARRIRNSSEINSKAPML
jgi:cellulose synthase (UDP-forming)